MIRYNKFRKLKKNTAVGSVKMGVATPPLKGAKKTMSKKILQVPVEMTKSELRELVRGSKVSPSSIRALDKKAYVHIEGAIEAYMGGATLMSM